MRPSRKLSLHSSRLHAGSDTVGTMGRLAPALPHVDAPYGLGVPECGDELADEHAVLGHALDTARDLIALCPDEYHPKLGRLLGKAQAEPAGLS